jgi:hypothetical protein
MSALLIVSYSEFVQSIIGAQQNRQGLNLLTSPLSVEITPAFTAVSLPPIFYRCRPFSMVEYAKGILIWGWHTDGDDCRQKA